MEELAELTCGEQECRKHTNLASLNIIIQALKSPYISGLHSISNEVPNAKAALANLTAVVGSTKTPIIPELSKLFRV